MKHDDKTNDHNRANGEFGNSGEISFTDIQNTVKQLQIENEKLKAENKKLYKVKKDRFAEYMSGIFENAAFGMYRTTPDGKILIANQALVEMLGYSSIDDLLGRNLENGEYEPGYSRVDFIKHIEKNSQVSGLVSAWTKRDGSIMYAREDCRAIRDNNGKTLYYDGIVEDITESEKNEEALHALSLQNEAILAAVPDIIAEIDNNKRYTWINQAGYDFFGDDIIGKDASYYFKGEQKAFNTVQPLFSGYKNVIYIESWQRRKDGEKRLLGWWYRVLKNSDGKVTGALATARDITEQKKADEALRLSEKKYRQVVEHASELIFSTDINGNFLFANSAVQKISGYSIEELRQLNYLDMILPEYRKRLQVRFMKQYLKCEPTSHIEYPLKTKDNKILWFAQNTSLNIENDKITGFHIVARDITERKQVEESLREAEERFKTIIETVPSLLAITDEKGNNIYISPNCKKITGYTREELKKDQVWMVHEDDHSRAKKIYEKTFSEGISGKDFEYKAVKKNGEIWYASSSWEPLRVGEGKFKGIVFQTIDITRRKRAEEDLRETRDYLENLINYANAPIIVWNSDLFITRFNHAFEQLTGRKAAEMIDSHLDILFPLQQREKMMALIKRTISGERWDGVEIPIQRTDGSVRIVLWNSATLYSSDGEKVIATVAQGQDITARKLAEDKIRQSLAEKEILLKEIHHRVKNNLQVISSLLELQSEHVTDNKTLEIFKLSQNRIKAMGLIHEHLYHSTDLSQIDFAGYIKYLLEHLYDSFGVNVETIKTNINVEDIHLSMNKAISFGLIINELVTNSLKYAFKDGEEGEIAINLHSDDGNYVLKISDTGARFPEDSDFKNTETLGLQLVNLLTKQLKGTIELNRKDKTEFIISFISKR